jgi:hypothetical protein
MRQRGKQSAASLDVNGIADAGPNLRPPHHLTAKEAQLFHEVVANAPSGHFSPSDVYLLSTFVRVTLICDDAAKALAKATDKNRPTRMKIMDQAVKAQALLASKLRLAPQSRIGPRTAGRTHDAHRPSAYDTMGFDREFFEDGWKRPERR